MAKKVEKPRVPQQGGILLRGTRVHESKKRPNANLDRKRWNASKGRDDSGPSAVSGGEVKGTDPEIDDAALRDD